MDNETIAVYDARADEYAELVKRDNVDPMLQVFMDAVPKGSRVLDLGCGNGGSSAVLVDAGYDVTAVDASIEMVKLCQRIKGLTVKLATFEEVVDEPLSEQQRFHGIWANFSLLHAPREQCRNVLLGLGALCKKPAWLHLGMKTGEGEQRDRLGRHYIYYSEDELVSLMKEADFDLEHRISGESKGLAGDIEPWVTLLGVRR